MWGRDLRSGGHICRLWRLPRFRTGETLGAPRNRFPSAFRSSPKSCRAISWFTIVALGMPSCSGQHEVTPEHEVGTGGLEIAGADDGVPTSNPWFGRAGESPSFTTGPTEPTSPNGRLVATVAERTPGRVRTRATSFENTGGSLPLDSRGAPDRDPSRKRSPAETRDRPLRSFASFGRRGPPKRRPRSRWRLRNDEHMAQAKTPQALTLRGDVGLERADHRDARRAQCGRQTKEQPRHERDAECRRECAKIGREVIVHGEVRRRQ